jgi:hypothetical protein
MPPSTRDVMLSIPVEISNVFFHCLTRSGAGLCNRAGVAMYVTEACWPVVVLALWSSDYGGGRSHASKESGSSNSNSL